MQLPLPLDQLRLFGPPGIVFFDKNGKALYFSRQAIPFVKNLDQKDWLNKLDYFKHIGVYAFRKHALIQFSKLEMKPLEISEKIECIRYLEYGMKIKMIETNFVGVGIDTPEDLEKARNLLSN